MSVKSEVRLLDPDEDLEEIWRLRYQVLVEDLGKEIPEADPQTRMISDDYDAASRHMIAVRDGELAGALRIHTQLDADYIRAIVVSESAELLIFNRRSIKRLRNQDPDLLAALLYNVARVLALRLRTALFDHPELRDEP